jgi:hypothetical protein
MMKGLWTAGILLALTILWTGSAEAGLITTYNDRDGFNTALTGVNLTVEEFTNTYHFPISTGILNSSTNLPEIGLSAGDIQPGVTYSTPIGSGFFFNIDSGGGYTGGSLDGLYGGDPNRAVTIAFDNAASAFAFDTNRVMGNNFDVTINFSGGGFYAQNFAIDTDTMQFFGCQSSQADIASVVIQGHGDEFVSFSLDNFTFTSDGAPPAPVPEPATISLLGLGLAGLALRRRRARLAR